MSLERAFLVRRAIRLEAFTIVYNLVEGVVAVGAGWLAGSVALVGFGIDSAIETTSAVVVWLRFRSEQKQKNFDASGIGERRAERLVGVTLILLSIYVLLEATTTLVRRETPEVSWIGMVLATASLIIMPILAYAKNDTGKALQSRALIADAKETLVCTYLSFTLLLGLAANALAGWWWADPVAALIMVPWIFKEGREAWGGES